MQVDMTVWVLLLNCYCCVGWMYTRVQMMKVQQESVDNYLEDIVMGAGGAVETAAEQQARQEIKEHAAAIDRLADELDKRFVSIQLCCLI